MSSPTTPWTRHRFACSAGKPEALKLAAILVADVAGFSRLAADDEERTLARRHALRSEVIDPAPDRRS